MSNTPLSPILSGKTTEGGGAVTPSALLSATESMTPEQKAEFRANIGATDAETSIPDDVKVALLDCFAHVAWVDDQGQTYYDALQAALYPLDHITAVYTQSGTVYDTDSLDSLKADLVVTAVYESGNTETVSAANYTLSGTLTAGTSTITVSYAGKTTTFDVYVEHRVMGWYYPFNQSIVANSTEDFGFSGVENYAEGVTQGKYAYYHKVGTEGTSSTDPLGIKAINITKVPDLSGDFTISFWGKLKTALNGTIICANKAKTGTTSDIVTPELVDNTWSIQTSQSSIGKYNYGFRFSYISSKLYVQFFCTDYSVVSAVLTLPNTIDTTIWHHYAVTRKNATIQFFFDGQPIWSASVSKTLVFNDQICLGNQFDTNTPDSAQLVKNGYSSYVQDFYVAESCKWDSTFDPSAIAY